MTDRAKILDKLRRLMAMTTENGASEAEALAAAEAAARVMAEHNLSYRSVEEIEAENFGDDTRAWFMGRKGRERSAPVPSTVHCLAAICELCGVEHLYNRYFGTLTFFGAKADTEVAHYLVVIISRAMDREWAAHRGKLPSGHTRQQRTSFYLGINLRIAQRLFAMAEQTAAATAGNHTGNSLIVVKNALVKERFQARHTGVKADRNRLKATDYSALRSGFAAGERVPLNKGINEAHGALAIEQAGDHK